MRHRVFPSKLHPVMLRRLNDCDRIMSAWILQHLMPSSSNAGHLEKSSELYLRVASVRSSVTSSRETKTSEILQVPPIRAEGEPVRLKQINRFVLANKYF